MRALVAALACFAAMAGLLLTAVAMPIHGSTVIRVESGCPGTTYRVGAKDLVGDPVISETLRVDQGPFRVMVPAGEYRLFLEAKGTRIMEQGSHTGWRETMLAGGCTDAPKTFDLGARGTGIVDVRVWLL